MEILNKSPSVALMKTVEVLFLVSVFISTLAINRLHFFILKFLLLKLSNYENYFNDQYNKEY